TGAIVMPCGILPLNIFEPRYLNMVRDAMQSDQLIGMIQPKEKRLDTDHDLYDIGCAARITQYAESTDGRLEIILTGLCRFKNKQELSTTRGYRLIMPDWSEYEVDYQPHQEYSETSSSRLKSALKIYFQANSFSTDWEILNQLSTPELINNLVGSLPFKSEDKQMLLEATSQENRLDYLIALLSSAGGDSKTRPKSLH
ncbi:LON peptidase substrate-binding domain-containing protein, partial [Arenicella sp.]|nr:LON peptidase substrate-binding domain-containing protein [Arenicella sp.]